MLFHLGVDSLQVKVWSGQNRKVRKEPCTTFAFSGLSGSPLLQFQTELLGSQATVLFPV